MLIAFEGIDGAGKSTQVNLLAEELRLRGHYVQTYSHPSDEIKDWFKENQTPGFERQRMCANEIKTRFEEVEKKSKKGDVIILDRWFYSTYAYGLAYDARPEEITDMYGGAKEIARLRPDIILFFNLDLDIALGRKAQKALSTDLSEKYIFLKKVSDNYRNIKKEEKRGILIDAAKDIEILQLEITLIIADKL